MLLPYFNIFKGLSMVDKLNVFCCKLWIVVVGATATAPTGVLKTKIEKINFMDALKSNSTNLA